MNAPQPPTSKLPYLLIVAVWLITRAYPGWMTEPWTYWEAGEAKKLLEYGFLARSGAIIDNFFMQGLVPEPGKFNYVNHPYPILWLDTLAYALGGSWAVSLTSAALGLGASLAVFPALKSRFSPNLSLLGALLFTLAPSAVLFTFNPNTVQLGAVLWAPAIYLIGKRLEEKSASAPFWLGVTVFLAGQIAWFSLTILPALLIASIALTYERSLGFTAQPKNPLPFAILLGGTLTLGVFISQIVFYSYNLPETFAYARGQAGAEDGLTLSRMYSAIATRGLLSVGPALLLGSLVGGVCLLKKRSAHWIQWASLIYPLLFLAAALALPRFFFRERTMYQYLLFPCTVLTISALESLQSRLARWGVISLAIVSLAYPFFQSSIPSVSQTSRKLATLMAELSKPTEVVVTNLTRQQPPFQPWDVGATNMASILSDRMIRENITSLPALQSLLKNYRTENLPIVFLYSPTRPIDPSLLAFLRSATTPISTPFEIPTEPPSAATQLRSLYWKATGKHQVTSTPSDQPTTPTLEVFQLTLSPIPTPKPANVSP